jgi:cellulose synthase/poly-beta-1,6-N-acetylglucosamine synthase-like glycosyltransferase
VTQEQQSGGCAYVLITAARNEEEFIELAIQSVVGQRVRPVKWVIVSDGSSDGTNEIVSRYATAYPWIDLVQLPERCGRDFASKARAFNVGLERLTNVRYDAIGNVDADVSFGEDYFEFLVGKLIDNPRLGVVGTAFRDRSLHYDYRFVSIEHVAGPCQLFRRQCLEAIGGYHPSHVGGVDHIAVLTARMKGWQTKTFTERAYIHHREMGTAGHSILAARFKAGVLDYALGGHPVWEFCRTMYQMSKRPFVIGALMLFAGYISAGMRRVERPVSRELVRFRRREQMQRLKDCYARTITRWPGVDAS